MSKLNLGNSLILDSDIVVNGGEVKTGATFNGKPVYRQTKSVAWNTSDTQVTHSHGISHISSVVKIDGITSNGTPVFMAVNNRRNEVAVDRNSIIMYTQRSDLYGRTADVDIYYTKTTD
jgi:uncharacterized Zn-binding protein involved in type VI secretion